MRKWKSNFFCFSKFLWKVGEHLYRFLDYQSWNEYKILYNISSTIYTTVYTAYAHFFLRSCLVIIRVLLRTRCNPLLCVVVNTIIFHLYYINRALSRNLLNIFSTIITQQIILFIRIVFFRVFICDFYEYCLYKMPLLIFIYKWIFGR